MDYRTENIIEITWILKEYAIKKYIMCIPFGELKELINDWSIQFETEYSDVDWNELDYNEEIVKFVNLNIAKELWDRFEDVPLNPDTEEIEEDWNGFLAGTSREDVWHWFENTFHVSVSEELMVAS